MEPPLPPMSTSEVLANACVWCGHCSKLRNLESFSVSSLTPPTHTHPPLHRHTQTHTRLLNPCHHTLKISLHAYDPQSFLTCIYVCVSFYTPNICLIFSFDSETVCFLCSKQNQLWHAEFNKYNPNTWLCRFRSHSVNQFQQVLLIIYKIHSTNKIDTPVHFCPDGAHKKATLKKQMRKDWSLCHW